MNPSEVRCLTSYSAWSANELSKCQKKHIYTLTEAMHKHHWRKSALQCRMHQSIWPTPNVGWSRVRDYKKSAEHHTDQQLIKCNSLQHTATGVNSRALSTLLDFWYAVHMDCLCCWIILLEQNFGWTFNIVYSDDSQKWSSHLILKCKIMDVGTSFSCCLQQ